MKVIKKYEFARNDKDLYSVLKQANTNELEMLSSIISGKYSSSIKETELSPVKITSEIQFYGGDSSINVLRRHGVCYEEILGDVAGKLKVKFNKDDAIIEVESKVVDTLWTEYKKTLSETDRAELNSEIERLSSEHASKLSYAMQKGQNALLPLVVAIGVFMAKRGALNTIPLIGQIISVILTLFSVVTIFTSPAYKVTVPCVFIVACIRARIITDSREAELDV